MERNIDRTALALAASGKHVASVGHAMELLALLVDSETIGVTEAGSRIGVAPSTAYRLMSTMAEYGFVAQTTGRRYRLGDAFAAAARSSSQLSRLIARLGPALRGLYDAVGETVHLMVLVGGDTQFVDGIESRRELRVGLRIGGRIPAYCSSGGKAILAALGPVALAEMYPHGLPPWPGQRLTSMDELRRELSEIRATGVAFNRGESEADVRALGVAVGTDSTRPVAALAVSVPEARFSGVDAPDLVEALLAARERARELLTEI